MEAPAWMPRWQPARGPIEMGNRKVPTMPVPDASRPSSRRRVTSGQSPMERS